MRPGPLFGLFMAAALPAAWGAPLPYGALDEDKPSKPVVKKEEPPAVPKASRNTGASLPGAKSNPQPVSASPAVAGAASGDKLFTREMPVQPAAPAAKKESDNGTHENRATTDTATLPPAKSTPAKLYDNAGLPCSEEMKNKHGCNQCFNAGFLYENQSMPLAEVIHNTGGLETNYYENEFVMPTINNKGNNVVTFNAPYFELAAEFTKDRLFDNGKGEKYVLLKPGESVLWIKTKNGYDLGFNSIDKSLINSANLEDIRDRNFTVVYTHRPRYWDDKSKKYSPTGSQKHVACQTIGAHFCGDGILDKDKEICDPRDTKKVNWTANGCSADCRPNR